MKTQNIPLLVLAAGLVIVSLVLAFNISSQEQDNENTINVNGDAELSVEPNRGEIYVKITTMNETAQEASNKNSEISEDVINALNQMGVSENDIETESYDVRRREDWNPKKEGREFTGYRVENVVKVTTYELNNTGNIIDTAINAGANGIQQVEFSLKDEREKEVKAEVLDMAAKNAEEKANNLAGSLGVELGQIQGISESNYFYQTSRSRGYSAAEAEDASTNVMPGEVEVSASVGLMYQIQ